MILTSLILASIPQEAHATPPQQEPLPAHQEIGLPKRESLRFAGEKHFGSIRRLTTDGENAEGYFSWLGDRISYQATVPGANCDQIYTLDLLTGSRELVSTGTGRTTCAYFMPDDEGVVFASTHAAGPDCMPPPDYSMGYVWKIYPQFDIFVRNLKTRELTALTHSPGYDAEAVVSPQGNKIAFTSTRKGDLDVYTMNLDGSGVKRLTNALGYDGGPFFSPDGKRIVYRAFHPKTEKERNRYLNLLNQDVIEPMALQIMIMDLDGDHKVQVTDNTAANFAPYFHPDNKRIVYCTNQASESGRDFDIFIINQDGTGNERVTTNPTFDGFPMFSHDGRRLIFASNRANNSPRDTNLFIADWIN
ncbi:MAG TPA: hypothetical protein QGG59_08415 [Planctomycetota bacterium]|jgi:dipeptidyl aminopeptidase/acylaminoacyl peptidase|nr:hypothetical protein [Planctomycetota bacterium]MDP7560005.1 hypothetical protein [Planctomycetota bacterium]HJM40125.1 hypothetical protein [Planctomycetota bacterium]|tara:strand:- start:17041 stop:18123 length:1083 start_codon:yes stop_codon:yes gene_type:complete